MTKRPSELNELTALATSDVLVVEDVSVPDVGYITRVNLEGQLDHDNLANFVVNEHVDHTSVSLTAGAGLSGGGNISATRTINVDINGQTSVTAATSDEVMIADASDTNNIKKVTAQSIADLSSAGVSGPASSKDNAIARFDGTDGGSVQGSNWILDDSDNLTAAGPLVDANGNELVTFTNVASAVNHVNLTNAATGNPAEVKALGDDTNIDLKLTPKGTGKPNLAGIKYPNTDGSANQIIETDGSGSLSFVDKPTAGLVLLTTAIASGDATIDFTSNIDSTYGIYRLFFSNVIPATDAVGFAGRTSSDGGSTWDSGASDYLIRGVIDLGYDSTTDDHINFTGNVGSAANEYGVSGYIDVHQPSDSNYTTLHFTLSYTTQNGNLNVAIGAVQRVENAAVDALRFYFDSGNVESGEFYLYGVKT